MKDYKHVCYKVYWSAEYYSAKFDDLEDAKAYAKIVNGVVKECIQITIDRPLKD